MNNEKIKDFSKEISEEIISRHSFNKEEIELLITIRLRQSLLSIINEYSTKEEAEYLRLLSEQMKHKVGSKEYNAIAYSLTFAKAKKASANRAANNVRREDNYQELKDFVKNKFGSECLNDYFAIQS